MVPQPRQGHRLSVEVLVEVSPAATVVVVALPGFPTFSRDCCWETVEWEPVRDRGLAVAREAAIQASLVVPGE